MIYKFKNEEISYKFFDRKSDVTNVFLHGWGCDSKSLFFCNKYAHANNLFLDFPPFGESSKDIRGWTIFTYANMVISLCEHLGLKKNQCYWSFIWWTCSNYYVGFVQRNGSKNCAD